MSLRGWNRCGCCCRFFSPDRDGYTVEEMSWLDIHGDLHQEWTYVCGRCLDQPDRMHDHTWLRKGME